MFKIENKKSFFQGLVTSGVVLFLLVLYFYYIYPLVQNPFPPITCIQAPCPQIDKVSLSSLVQNGPKHIKYLEKTLLQISEERKSMRISISQCLSLLEENNILACKNTLQNNLR